MEKKTCEINYIGPVNCKRIAKVRFTNSEHKRGHVTLCRKCTEINGKRMMPAGWIPDSPTGLK